MITHVHVLQISQEKNCTSKLTPGSQYDVMTALHALIRKWHSPSIRKWCSVCDAKLYRNWVSLHLLKHGCNTTWVKPTALCPYCKPGLILTIMTWHNRSTVSIVIIILCINMAVMCWYHAMWVNWFNYLLLQFHNLFSVCSPLSAGLCLPVSTMN